MTCPYCKEERFLTETEMETAWNHGKVVIADCDCGRLYTVEDDGDCVFTS